MSIDTARPGTQRQRDDSLRHTNELGTIEVPLDGGSFTLDFDDGSAFIADVVPVGNG
jgi:hypothetical protein